MKRNVIAASILTVAAIAGAGTWFYYESRPTSISESAPQRTSNLWGLWIGTEQSDVLFEKGEPDSRITYDGADFVHFVYERGNVSYWVSISNSDEKVYSLAVRSPNVGKLPLRKAEQSLLHDVIDPLPGSMSYRDTLVGIKLGDVPLTITSYLGEPEEIEELEGGLRRVYSYRERLNVSYTLERGRVITLSVGRALSQ